MIREEFEKVVKQAVDQRGCILANIIFDDDDNVFEVLVDKADSQVQIADCEYIHRAVLAAFDRNIEDYSLTVGSVGLSSEEADEILKSIKD